MAIVLLAILVLGGSFMLIQWLTVPFGLPFFALLLGAAVLTLLVSYGMLRWLVFSPLRQDLDDALMELRVSQAIADGFADWSWEQDAEHHFTDYSLAPEALLNAGIINAALWDVPGVEPVGGWEPLRAALAERQPFRLCFSLDANGQRHWYELAGAPIHDHDDNFLGYCGAGREITAQRQQLDELQEKNRELSALLSQRTLELATSVHQAHEASVAKSEFLAHISHEIRTPMNLIMGTAQLFGRSETTEQQQRWLANIGKASDHLLALINDVLDFSRGEAGKIQLEQRAMELDGMIRSWAQMFADRAEAKGIKLIVDERWDPGLAPIGDAKRLGQIVINFLSNAVKFTEEGFVRLRVTGVGEGEQKIRLRIEVTDSGPGLTEKQSELVFDAFQQAELSTSRKFGGTGLGLAIARQMAELMGGRIGLDSVPGKGSTFWFEGLLDATSTNVVPPGDISLHAVLIADDEGGGAQVLQSYVESCLSCVTLIDPSGLEQGLERLIASKLGVDVFLVDGATGLQDTDLTQRLASTFPAAYTIYFLGNAQRDPELSAAANVAILHKPLCRQEIWQLLAGGRQRGQAESAVLPADTDAAKNDAELAGVRILVVDDDADNRELLEEILEGYDFEVLLAEDGQQAVDLLTGGTLVSLVLMDQNMPVLNGVGATRAIRQQLGKQAPPIVALTAGVTQQQRAETLESGMVAFTPKPVQIETLLETINTVVTNRAALADESAGIAPADILRAYDLLDDRDPAIQGWLADRSVTLRLAMRNDYEALSKAIGAGDHDKARYLLREFFLVEQSLASLSRDAVEP